MATAGVLSAAGALADEPKDTDGEWVDVPGAYPVQRNTATGHGRLDPDAFKPGEYGPGRDSYGRTDEEQVAQQRMMDPANAGAYVTIAESIKIRDAGLGPHTNDDTGIIVPGATLEQKQAFVDKLREVTPLPTTFAPKPIDPGSIVAKEEILRPVPAGTIPAVQASAANSATIAGAASVTAPGVALASLSGGVGGVSNGDEQAGKLKTWQLVALVAAAIVAGLYFYTRRR